MPIEVIERATGKKVEEKVFGGFWVNLIYQNQIGRKIFASGSVQKGFSKLYGIFQSSTFSRKQVDNFIHNFGVNMENFEMPLGGYQNFNEFFIRKKKTWKTLFPEKNTEMGSPCDARLFAAKIERGKTVLHIKGKHIPIDLLAGVSCAEDYAGGTALVFRLCPVDYHRFHFVDAGQCGEISSFGTKLHSVNPVSLQEIEGVFLENERQVSFLKSENFGKVGIIEVGALNVGKIVQTFKPNRALKRGEEKGFFEFGASTQVLLLEKSVTVDQDILSNSANGFETLVQTGEKIAST